MRPNSSMFWMLGLSGLEKSSQTPVMYELAKPGIHSDRPWTRPADDPEPFIPKDAV